MWWVVLVALAAGTYVGTLGNNFAFDDRIIILIKARQWQDESLWEVVKHDYWGELRLDALWRPVTTVSYVLNYRLSADRPETYRAINIALHALCCLALFGLTTALFGDRRLAGVASALFAVHALHVEAVAQVVGRAELLTTLWALLAVWVYVVDARRKSGTPTWRYPIALALAGLAMLSKESGFAVVGLAAAYDVWSQRFSGSPRDASGSGRTGADLRGRRWSSVVGRLALRRWAGLFAVVMLVLTARMQVLGQLAQDRGVIDKVDNPVAHASTAGRVWTPVAVLGKYVRLLIWPDPLCHDYSYNALPVRRTPADVGVLWGLACLAAMVVGAWRSSRRQGRVLWCILFFLLSYAIVSNTFALSGTIFAERLMYFPSVAFCWAVAVAVVAAMPSGGDDRGSPRRSRWAVAVVLSLACTAHVFLAVRRGEVWRDERIMIADALRVTDDSCRLHMQAGHYALIDEDAGLAIRHLERAIEILPDHASAHLQLGRAHLLDEHPERAIPPLLTAFGHLPDEANVAAAAYLARAYRALGQRDEAAKWLRRAKTLKGRLKTRE